MRTCHALREGSFLVKELGRGVAASAGALAEVRGLAIGRSLYQYLIHDVART